MARTRTRTPRGMAELSGFRLSSPDSVFGADITPSLFTEDDAPPRDDAEDRARAERFAAARDWYYAEGATLWQSDAFGHWLADRPRTEQFASYPAALRDWTYSESGRAYLRAHGRRESPFDGWTYGQPLATDAPIPSTADVAAGADRARARAAAAGEYVQPLMRTPRD